jgi:hypothetical protein
MSAAANSHIVREGDLGRHDKGQFNRVTHPNRKIGVEHGSSRAQILGKAAAFTLGSSQTETDRQMEFEALGSAPLNMN